MIRAKAIRAIAVKELRETVGFAALALVVLAYFVFTLMQPSNSGNVPFVQDSFDTTIGVVCWMLAVVLGLRQSAWERIRGTYAFLLHRPAQASTIFAAKIATGVALLQLVAAVPILWYGMWASMPKTHPSPFEWSMTESAWRMWLSLPVAYLSAFLSGVRPARWFGTRLLPSVAGSFSFIFFIEVLRWPYALLGSAALSAVLISLVFYEAKNSDFG